MCTAVVGGSIRRTATSMSTASDQRSATPARNHPTKDRREPFRGGVSGGRSGFSVTLQNNRLGWIDIAPDESHYRTTGFFGGIHFSGQHVDQDLAFSLPSSRFKSLTWFNRAT